MTGGSVAVIYKVMLFRMCFEAFWRLCSSYRAQPNMCTLGVPQLPQFEVTSTSSHTTLDYCQVVWLPCFLFACWLGPRLKAYCIVAALRE